MFLLLASVAVKTGYLTIPINRRFGHSTVLNRIRFPGRDPTGFCNSELDPDRTEFRKNSTESDTDVQSALINAVKCLIREFFGHKPDWIKYLDRSAGLGQDRNTQWKFWTNGNFGSQKSQICSTLPLTWCSALFVPDARAAHLEKSSWAIQIKRHALSTTWTLASAS